MKCDQNARFKEIFSGNLPPQIPITKGTATISLLQYRSKHFFYTKFD